MVRHGKLVLIVDRDLDFVEDLRTLLSDHRTLSARTLTEAVEMVIGGRVDVVVLGPSFGSEADVRSAADVLAEDPEVSIVLVANIVTNRVLRAALELGFIDVVDTPVTPRKISEVLDRAPDRGGSREPLVSFQDDEPAPDPALAHAAAYVDPEILQDTAGPVPSEAPVVPLQPAAPVASESLERLRSTAPVASEADLHDTVEPPVTPPSFEGVELVFGGGSSTSADVLEFASAAPHVDPTPAAVPVEDASNAPAAPEAIEVQPAVAPAPEVSSDPAPPVMAPPMPVPAEPMPPAMPPPTTPVSAPQVTTQDAVTPLPMPESAPPMPAAAAASYSHSTTPATTATASDAQRPHPRRLTGKGRIVTVTAGKAGSGKTIAATNLAAALGERLGPDRVVIVDADLQFGDVALLLQLEPSRTILEAAGAIDSLTDARLDSMLLRHESGLRVLPAPLLPQAPESTPIQGLVAVLERLKRMYDVVVVDTPPIFGPTLLSILDHSDTVLMVVDMDLPSVKNAKIAIDMLRRDGYPADRVNLVVNRVNSKARLDLVELERSLGLRVSGSIPSDRIVPQSVNEGIPVVLLSPRSRVAKSFHSLAERFGPESVRQAS
jgi:Flp pilus assembly CpaE family ATPase/DNA-binding NarL/FixJ family response regulator